MTFTEAALTQLDSLLVRFENMKKRSRFNSLADVDESEKIDFITMGLAAISRIAGDTSVYAKETARNLEAMHWSNIGSKVDYVAGALKALRQDVANGYLVTFQQLIHASLFADFLEMSEHLLKEGYKDPAAVLSGGVLEEHLRKLCQKHNVSVEFLDAKGDTRPKKADSMNADLGNSAAYSKLDQKQVTTWLELRNKAAHGHYDEYTKEQVAFFIQSLVDFMQRNPA